MNRILFVLLLTPGLPRPDADTGDGSVRWASQFQESYHSRAEGTRVTFPVKTPPQVDGMRAYPLLVTLSGGLRAAPGQEFPFFQASPTRTRIWGYRALSAYDAMQVIDVMLRKYPIDPDRVYLMGASAGGSGAMHLASCFPDRFAAVLPLVAAGNNYPLANFTNLPVAFHHGDRDWTSAICNVRVQAQRMKAAGCPVVLREYPGAGHSIPGSHKPLVKWLFQQKRNRIPSVVTHDCEAPSLGRSYWISIREFGDPHQRATVRAAIDGDTIRVEPQNTESFSLSEQVLSGISAVEVGASRLPPGRHFRHRDGHWEVQAEIPRKPGRSYEAGAVANLYQGEPLLIVHGTSGDHAEHLRAAAGRIAKCGGPDYSAIPGAFPVVRDTDLTRTQEAQANLLLIGTPEQNSVVQRLLPALPVTIQDGRLIAGARDPLPLEDQIMCLVCRHPEHPDRLVCLLAPFLDKAGLARFAEAPVRFLSGSDGFDRVSQADLLVQNLQRQIARQMQFDQHWKWITLPGADRQIARRYAERSRLAMACMKIMLDRSHADFALWWGPADPGMWGADFNDLEAYNPRFYTEADFRTQRRDYETMTGKVTGAELREIWNRWGLNRELLFAPGTPESLPEDSREYRIHIPMDLYIKLGQRRKNLIAPQAGPVIPADALLHEVFP